MKLDTRVRKVALGLYESLDTPISLTCYLLLKNGEFGQLANKAVDPLTYLEGSVGARRYARDAQAVNFLRKSPLLPLGIDRTVAAEKTFLACEEQCYRTNQFLRLLSYPSNSETAAETALRSILNRARKIMMRILGPIPESIQGRFGPGTCYELKGSRYTTVLDKLTATTFVTPDCQPLFELDYWSTQWGRESLVTGRPLPQNTRGNRFTTVPKDALKDRGICVEPGGNLWVQLCIGGELKRLAARAGLQVGRMSLPDDPLALLQMRSDEKDRVQKYGQPFHRRKAKEGSVDDSWTTIDLSNASDTVAYELVRWVYPTDWFDLLCAARSPMTLFRGKWFHLDKFSSMGNGFTFEVESLLFAVILAAGLDLKVGRDVFSYGDDILVPGAHSRDAMAILEACGLEVNRRKSFASGPFRESCGGDYFSGHPVRSVYCKSEMDTPLDWVSLHNQLRSTWGRLAAIPMKRCVESVPVWLRLYGPSRLGDRVFHSAAWQGWVQDGVHWLATIAPIHERVPISRWGSQHLSAALLGASSTGITPRDSKALGYRISRASVS